MHTIEPTQEYINQFIVSGLSIRTKNSDEFDPKTAKIPTLWQQFYSSNLAGSQPLLGVYSDYESEVHGFYTLTLGSAQDQQQPKLNQVIIHAGHYLLFQNRGPMPATVIDTWKEVWHYFSNQLKYQRRFLSDFELYTGPDQVTIHIGITISAA